MEKHAPCLDKNCGHCCDPVRFDIRNTGDLPKDKKVMLLLYQGTRL